MIIVTNNLVFLRSLRSRGLTAARMSQTLRDTRAIKSQDKHDKTEPDGNSYHKYQSCILSRFHTTTTLCKNTKLDDQRYVCIARIFMILLFVFRVQCPWDVLWARSMHHGICSQSDRRNRRTKTLPSSGFAKRKADA